MFSRSTSLTSTTHGMSRRRLGRESLLCRWGVYKNVFVQFVCFRQASLNWCSKYRRPPINTHSSTSDKWRYICVTQIWPEKRCVKGRGANLDCAKIVMLQELVQAVYNWPYIQCISLWCRCLSGVHKRLEDDHMAAEAQSTLTAEQRTNLQAIDELRYPLVQIAIGTARYDKFFSLQIAFLSYFRLVASPRFYPLRLHCVRALVRLIQKDLSYFIPILPLLTDVRWIVPSPYFSCNLFRCSAVISWRKSRNGRKLRRIHKRTKATAVVA